MRAFAAFLSIFAASCGLVLDFDPEERRAFDTGVVPPPDLDGGSADARRDARRDGRPDTDMDAPDAEVDADVPPEDMGPDPDAGCSCDETTSSGCVSGACVCGSGPACGGREICCAGDGMIAECVDPKNDDLNCGGCGIACAANARCDEGVCICDDGFADCDGEPGCEADLAGDPLHCGDCGVACDPVAPSCSAGECVSCTGDADCAGSSLDCLLPAACDASTGVCIPGSIEDGACLVDGECFGGGDRNPAAPCLVCNPDVDPFTWTPDQGQSCDDGRSCTHEDTCDPSGACVGIADPCDDRVACTNDFCDLDTTGECRHEPMPGFCIDPRDPNMCVIAGRPGGPNACIVCNGDTHAFEPAPAMTSCDDADHCNGREVCDAIGNCTRPPSGVECPASLPPCFVRACNPATGMCDLLRDAFCFIDGECRMEGPNPANPCLECDPDRNRRGWSPLPAGVSCRDNATCRTGVCNGTSACTLMSPACNTARHQTCNASTGACACAPGFASCSGTVSDDDGCECNEGGCEAGAGICVDPATT
ncbi:MAG: hypothetical protein IT379_34710 [Deltaproteobacteria bacterium]|nr:hypothetical protein [Deltaproteobacteria bacterium]